MTTVRLAMALFSKERVARALAPKFEDKAAVLVSLVYLKPFLEERKNFAIRDWVLDSGAYSAFSAGTVIDLGQFIETSKHLLATDPQLSEVFALDVIGDWKASMKNTERMWNEGVPAIPCYHLGEPEHVLMTLARHYPKIALGGCARMSTKKKNDWAAQCFARIWPKKVHGFGFGSPTTLEQLPFHSVDASTWELRTTGFGQWHSYGGKFSVRGSKQYLRPEVDFFLDIERKAKVKWGAAIASIPEFQPRIEVA